MADSFKLVTVLESGDLAFVSIVKSMLEDAGIEYDVKNEGVQNLFGLGSIGNVNPIVGLVKIRVKEEDREKAEALLTGLNSSENQEGAAGSAEDLLPPADPANPPPEGFLAKLRRWLLG